MYIVYMYVCVCVLPSGPRLKTLRRSTCHTPHPSPPSSPHTLTAVAPPTCTPHTRTLTSIRNRATGATPLHITPLTHHITLLTPHTITTGCEKGRGDMEGTCITCITCIYMYVVCLCLSSSCPHMTTLPQSEP